MDVGNRREQDEKDKGGGFTAVKHESVRANEDEGEDGPSGSSGQHSAGTLSTPSCSYSSVRPVEQRLRSRIDRFLAGYGLTPMGKAVGLNWIQVGRPTFLLSLSKPTSDPCSGGYGAVVSSTEARGLQANIFFRCASCIL